MMDIPKHAPPSGSSVPRGQTFPTHLGLLGPSRVIFTTSYYIIIMFCLFSIFNHKFLYCYIYLILKKTISKLKK